jgi:hypothetical protein
VSISTTSGLHIHHTKSPVGTLLQSALLAARHVYKELFFFLFHFPLVVLKSRFLENWCPKLCTVDLKYCGSSSPVLPNLEKKERNSF